MAKEFEIEVLTRSKTLYKGKATEVVLPAYDGEVGVLADHANFIGLLGTGPLKVVTGGDDGATEAGALRDVNRRNGGCRVAVPGLQTLQHLPGSVRQRQCAWVTAPRSTRPGVDQTDTVRTTGERQRESHSHRAGTDDRDVDRLLVFRHGA